MADIHPPTVTDAKIYFYLVNQGDGLTPVTDQGGQQPQISINGGSFQATGVGVLNHSGFGHYYANVNLSTLNTQEGDRVVGRYRGGSSAEAPSMNQIKVSIPNNQLGGSGFNAGTHSLVALRKLSGIGHYAADSADRRDLSPNSRVLRTAGRGVYPCCYGGARHSREVQR